MTSILESFPTTEDEDAALLDSRELTDWRERVIVQFRMLRKRALRLTIQVIAAEYQGWSDTCTQVHTILLPISMQLQLLACACRHQRSLCKKHVLQLSIMDNCMMQDEAHMFEDVSYLGA